ncbi:MAG: ATP-binding protein [Verrucomicrobiales bacterium]|nr:ATP-binding protein [Verrucomicrobiales bacterium]
MSTENQSYSATPMGFNGEAPQLPPVAQPDLMFSQPVSSPSEAEATLTQLGKVVSEFMIKYPSHTHRIPSVRPGEHALIAFVRQMAASMANKQEELEILNNEVTEAAREKERFLANMSHEVRTPMNGIFGMVNLLLEMELDPVQREYLDTIHASSESLLNILDDILDYAKLNANQMPLKPRNFELGRLIRDVLLVYKPTADNKGVNLAATICESLPDSFTLDDLRLKQVISNLVSNAIKFTDEGEVSLTVRGIEKSGRNQLFFEVKDSGIGITAEAGKNLFAPFRQLDSEDERRYEGTGLGLAISKNIVELMGGCVWFESEMGSGTTFFFTVDYDPPEPARSDVSDLVSRGKLERHQTSSVKTLGKLRVLLVEDNKVNQKVASLTLQQLGCEVTIAGNGQEAVNLADGPIEFKLICMDVNMPVMDGLTATMAIRALAHPNAEAHILAMTGMAFEEDKEKCRDAGMDDVVTKPFDINDLRTRIDALKASQSESVALSS